jgi:hypothetical protein
VAVTDLDMGHLLGKAVHLAAHRQGRVVVDVDD